MQELSGTEPDGLRCMTSRLAGGVTFVHAAVTDGERDPLQEPDAFAAFQNGVRDRVTAPPEEPGATVVGSYGFPGRPPLRSVA